MGPTRRLRIRGRVQGVGFRYFVLQRATELGVEGWVRNRIDGSVDAVVRADDDVLSVFLARVEEGPRWGRVDRLDVADEPGTAEELTGFHIRSDR